MLFQDILASIRELSIEDHTPIVTQKGALFLQQMISIANPTTVVEIGAAVGYSTMILASALQQEKAHIWSFEKSTTRFARAKDYIKESPYSDKITISCGDVFDYLPQIPEQIDFAFIDGMKRETQQYFELIYPRIVPGGVVIIDDVLKFPEKMAHFYNYLDTVKIPHSILPIDEDDGVMLFVKKDSFV